MNRLFLDRMKALAERLEKAIRHFDPEGKSEFVGLADEAHSLSHQVGVETHAHGISAFQAQVKEILASPEGQALLDRAATSSFAWTEEFSVFLMILLALVAGSAAVARDRHIRIEYFAENGSMARRKRLAQFGAIMVALLFLLIGALSLRMVWDDYRFEETSPGIGVPQWWYSIWLPVVSFAIALRALGLFIRRGRKTNYGDSQR
jgi:TRAP-type C4-dicarboxylate transport system permease small subunit